MQALPHLYAAAAGAAADGEITLSAAGLPALASAAPREFDGPGDRWSPEMLLVAAVADCFVLTFRAIASASKFAWNELHCAAEGRLDRADGVMRFTEIALNAALTLPAGGDAAKAQRLLEKAEKGCLVMNSLTAQRRLSVSVKLAG